MQKTQSHLLGLDRLHADSTAPLLRLVLIGAAGSVMFLSLFATLYRRDLFQLASPLHWARLGFNIFIFFLY